MKTIKLLIAVFFFVGIASCGSAPSTPTATVDGKTFFGEKIEEAGALTMQQLLAKMGPKEEMKTKVKGQIDAVCKVKGCWMTMDKGDGSTMRVKFKDYGFFVPKDCEGKTAVIEGTASISTTSVADLKHYAEDEGLSQAEIDKITEPEKDLEFMADGVILY